MIDCQARMVKQADQLVRRHPDCTVAIVSHGDPLRALVAYYLGIPIDLLLRFELDIGSVSEVEIGGCSPRVLCLNHTGEFPA